jgi:hypothetical protein
MTTPWGRRRERQEAEAAICAATTEWLKEIIAETDRAVGQPVVVLSAVDAA